jgi:hypothetical protein
MTETSSALARTRSAPGTHAFAAAAASARERQRCSRRFGAPQGERRFSCAHSDLALVRADQRVRAEVQPGGAVDRCLEPSAEGLHDGGDRVAVDLVAGLARVVHRDQRHRRRGSRRELEQRHADALLLEAVPEPAAPGVIARPAGEGDVRAVVGGDHRNVRHRAAEVGHERVTVRDVVERTLADEVNERLAEAHGRGAGRWIGALGGAAAR